MMITDAVILDEAVRLVSEDVSVTLPVNGRSMLPFIIGGRESVILQKPHDVCVGDVVLAWVEGSRWVVHRIIRIDGDRRTWWMRRVNSTIYIIGGAAWGAEYGGICAQSEDICCLYIGS